MITNMISKMIVYMFKQFCVFVITDLITNTVTYDLLQCVLSQTSPNSFRLSDLERIILIIYMITNTFPYGLIWGP